MKLVDTEQERDQRTATRLQALENLPEEPMEVQSIGSQDDLTVSIPLSSGVTTTQRPDPGAPPNDLTVSIPLSKVELPAAKIKPNMKRSQGDRPNSSPKIPKKK